MIRFRRMDALWGLGYLVMLGLIVVGLGRFRAMAVQKYSSPEHLADWEKFRNEMAQIEKQVENNQFEGPVARRMPKSPKPPVLVLMRDHYATCLAGIIVFVTGIYLVLVVLLRGALGARPRSAAPLKNSDAL